VAGRSGFVNRAIAIGPSLGGCPIEVTVGGLYQASDRAVAVRAVEAIQRRQPACRGDFEGRAFVVGPAARRCPVEVPVGGLK
jgi:hypothetical protein